MNSDLKTIERIERAGLKRPRTLYMAITGTCNLRCGHCWVESPRPLGDLPPVPVNKLCRLVEEFLTIGGEEICLTGGEPLTHPGWLNLISFACRQQGLRSLRLQTNAMLFTRQHVETLRSLKFEGLSFQVSLDGATIRTHDRVRGEGAFVRTLAGLNLLAESGFGERVSISFTEMRHNMEEIPALLDIADRLGLNSVVGSTLAAHGRARRSALLAPPLPAQYTNLLARYHRDAGFRELYHRLGRFAAVEWWLGRSRGGEGGCAFIEHPYVTPDGFLFPCALLHAEAFAGRGVFERPLAEVISEAIPLWRELLATSRDRCGSLKSCSRCPGKEHCGGGCLARAWLTHGEAQAEEDRCRLRQAVYRWRPEDESA